jgi:hypothetical protein
MKNYTTIFFLCFVLFFSIIVIFNYINFFHFFIFISGAYVFPFFFFLTLIFFLSNLYIFFNLNDYFSFVNFKLNSGNNYEFLFVETQFFQYISRSIFRSTEFFCLCFPICLKISFFYFYICEGWLKKKKNLFDKTFSYICGFHWN